LSFQNKEGVDLHQAFLNIFLTLLRNDADSNVEPPFDDVSDDEMLGFVCGRGFLSVSKLAEFKTDLPSSSLVPALLPGLFNVLLAVLYASVSLLLMLERHGGTEP
jgi:hypothetical protein